MKLLDTVRVYRALEQSPYALAYKEYGQPNCRVQDGVAEAGCEVMVRVVGSWGKDLVEVVLPDGRIRYAWVEKEKMG